MRPSHIPIILFCWSCIHRQSYSYEKWSEDRAGGHPLDWRTCTCRFKHGWRAYRLFSTKSVTHRRAGGLCSVSSILSFPIITCQERLFQVLMQMGRNVKLTISGADLNGRNSIESYLERDGELVGCIKLVKLWHAIGHTVCLVVF